MALYLKTATVRYDGGKLRKTIEQKGLLINTLSEEIGYNRSYLTNQERKGTINRLCLEKVCEKLNVSVDDYILSEVARPAQEGPEMPESDFEKEVKEMLKMLVKDVQELKQALLKEPVKAEEAQQTEVVFLPEIDRAVNLLEKMMGNRRWLKYEDYRLALEDEEDITNGEMLSAAINKLGLRKMARGYGNNKTLWIVTDEAKQKLDNDNEGDE